MRQIILDTETTGLNPGDGHKIIEVGCLELTARKLTQNNFHKYLNPDREIDAGAVEVHGLTTEFLADKPHFSDIAEALLDYLKGAELIIHNAPFDVGFLDHEFRQVWPNWPGIKSHCEILDTLVMARQMRPGQRNSLDALCKAYDISNEHRQLHGALLDSELLAEVYLRMTGGQTGLFEEGSDHSTVTTQKSEITHEQIAVPLVAREATQAEVSVHQGMLNQMKENGACVWLAED